MSIRPSAVGLAIATVLVAWSTQAQNHPPTVAINGAAILWYGIYEADTATKEADATAPGGSRLTAANARPPRVNSDRIELADNIRFGFGYRLDGQPKGAVVQVKTVQR